MTLTIESLAWGHPVPGGSWRQLFQNFSLTCPAGQFVVVIGSNGSGKSTLLNLIAGTLKAGAGSVQLDPEDSGLLRQCRRRQARAIWPSRPLLSHVRHAPVRPPPHQGGPKAMHATGCPRAPPPARSCRSGSRCP